MIITLSGFFASSGLLSALFPSFPSFELPVIPFLFVFVLFSSICSFSSVPVAAILIFPIRSIRWLSLTCLMANSVPLLVWILISKTNVIFPFSKYVTFAFPPNNQPFCCIVVVLNRLNCPFGRWETSVIIAVSTGTPSLLTTVPGISPILSMGSTSPFAIVMPPSSFTSLIFSNP